MSDLLIEMISTPLGVISTVIMLALLGETVHVSLVLRRLLVYTRVFSTALWQAKTLDPALEADAKAYVAQNVIPTLMHLKKFKSIAPSLGLVLTMLAMMLMLPSFSDLQAGDTTFLTSFAVCLSSSIIGGITAVYAQLFLSQATGALFEFEEAYEMTGIRGVARQPTQVTA